MKRYVGQWVGDDSELKGPGKFVVGDDVIPMVTTPEEIDWSTSTTVAWRFDPTINAEALLAIVPAHCQLVVVYTMGQHSPRTHWGNIGAATDLRILPAIYIETTTTEFDRRWTCIDLALVWVGNDVNDFGIANWLLSATSTVITSHPERLRAIAGVDWWLDPLAPATTDMTVDVYNTFSADSAKYQAYADAVELAITDWQAPEPPTVMIVGAGTGLIADAIAHLGYGKLEIVEKNPHCYGTLEAKLAGWRDCRLHLTSVTPTIADADIIVLEMLGSFGDNERFPEIRQQMPMSTVSIPQQYSLVVYPIHSHHSVPGFRPYVAKLSRYYPLADATEIWRFDGGNDGTERHGSVSWTATEAGTINAIMGTFRAQLYGHVAIHNCPATPLLLVNGQYCSLWFPMVFPVADYHVEIGDTITFAMWRRLDSNRVWYEWQFQGTRYNIDGTHFSF